MEIGKERAFLYGHIQILQGMEGWVIKGYHTTKEQFPASFQAGTAWSGRILSQSLSAKHSPVPKHITNLLHYLILVLKKIEGKCIFTLSQTTFHTRVLHLYVQEREKNPCNLIKQKYHRLLYPPAEQNVPQSRLR